MSVCPCVGLSVCRSVSLCTCSLSLSLSLSLSAILCEMLLKSQMLGLVLSSIWQITVFQNRSSNGELSKGQSHYKGRPQKALQRQPKDWAEPVSKHQSSRKSFRKQPRTEQGGDRTLTRKAISCLEDDRTQRPQAARDWRHGAGSTTITNHHQGPVPATSARGAPDCPLQDPNTKMFKRTLIYYYTDTQYANLRGNPLRQATKRHLTVKRLKTMKNEKETYLFLVDLLSLMGRSQAL